MTCPICTDNYTSSSRKKITCLYCQYECCTQCIKKYITSNNNDPCCLNCKHSWNREFIDATLSRNFRIKEYKKHRENVLFDRESSFFQETVSLIDKNQEQKEYVHDKIRNVLKERKELQKKLGELNNSISGFRGNISFLEAKSTNVITDFTAIEKKTFIKMCGIKDCKGYINHKGTCALCKNVICMQCHEDKIQGHECKPENIESVNKIKKETKSCPNCQVAIYKIDGCRQMWCTQCHTAFDWRTGCIIRERIHNPHYYEWERNNDSATTNNNSTRTCNENELPTLSQLRNWAQNLGMEFTLKRKIFDIHRSIGHLQDIEMRRLQEENRDQELFQRNIDTRVLFLQSKMDEQSFKNQLILKENRLERFMNLYLLYEMVCNTCISLFHECLIFDSQSLVQDHIKKFETLAIYANNQLSIHSKRFNVRPLEFDNNLFLRRI